MFLSVFGVACTSSTSTDQPEENDPSLVLEEDPWANSTEVPPEPELPLPQLVDALNDSIRQSWQVLLDSDNAKLAAIKVVIKEIGQISGHNKVLLDSVADMHKILSAAPLNYEQMENPSNIERYDDLFGAMIDKVSRLYNLTRDNKLCTNCASLISGVKESYNDDLVLRMRYDSFVKDFNTVLQQKRDSLNILGGKYQQFKRYPLFSIQETVVQ
jgi:hypothetical protein